MFTCTQMIIVTSLVMVNASIVIILCKLINEKYRSKDCFFLEFLKIEVKNLQTSIL